jgi:hypothetical protein
MVFDPADLAVIEVIEHPYDDPGFPAGTALYKKEAPENRCGGDDVGIVIGWTTDPENGSGIFPSGEYTVARLCFTLVAGDKLKQESPLQFVNCLGPVENPYRNIYTSESGESVPLFTFDAPEPRYFKRGDVNDDGWIDISDPIAICLYFFAGAQAPACLDTADADDNGEINIVDAVYLLSWRFSDGEAPPAPFPHCGPDTTGDDYTECVYRSCNY